MWSLNLAQSRLRHFADFRRPRKRPLELSAAIVAWQSCAMPPERSEVKLSSSHNHPLLPNTYHGKHVDIC
jgi:hypothetical protein